MQDKKAEADPLAGTDLYKLETGQQSKDTTKISFFKCPITNLSPYSNCSISDIHSLIKEENYKTNSEKLRSINDKKEQSSFKNTNFDYVTFSGTFSRRANTDIIIRSEYFCCDLDGLNNIEEIGRTILYNFKPILMFTSPSGDGLKVVFKIDTSAGNHEQFFKALENYFVDYIGVKIDPHCKDISRACFIPYDPSAYYNPDPDVLGTAFLDTFLNTDYYPQNTDPINEVINNGDFEEVVLQALTLIRDAEEGEKHGKLLRASRLMGRLISGKQIVETEAIQLLEEEIKKKPIHNFKTAQRTIKDGIAYGKPYPLRVDKAEKTPLMPISGFPFEIQQVIRECSRIYGTHQDLWAGAILSATSAALGQSAIVKNKYENAPLLWLAVVAATGIGKTQPFNFALKPIHKIDEIRFNQYEKKRAKYNIEAKAAKVAKKTPPPAPELKQSIIIDATPEALAKANNANQRGVSIFRDELNGWISDFGRYSKSGEQQNMLSSWMQQPFKIIRVKSDTIFINHPFINVFGGIQPSILPDMAKDNRSLNGFLQRFVFVFPDKVEAPMYTREELPHETYNAYQRYIETLMDRPCFREPIRLTDEAECLYELFYNRNKELNNSGQSEYLNQVNAKLDIVALRFALLLHYSKWVYEGEVKDEPQTISARTMESAIELTEYFRITARKVHDIITESSVNKKEIIRYLSDLGNSQPEIAKVMKVSQPYINKVLRI